MLVANNVVSLAGNVAEFYSGITANITGRNNYINKNGFLVTGTGAAQVGPNDFETAVVIATNGVPATVLPGETFTGSNNTGLAENTVIPTAPVYKNQSGTWQAGAFVK